MNMREISNNINFLTIEELKELNKIVVLRIKNLDSKKQLMASASLNVGDQVSFDSKRGYKVVGEVIKVNSKTIHVKTEQGTWKVSPSLLTKINTITKEDLHKI